MLNIFAGRKPFNEIKKTIAGFAWWQLALMAVAFLYWIKTWFIEGDFDMFISTCDLLKSRKSIYTPDGIRNLYWYTPTATFLLTPFSYLPSFLYRAIWKGLNILMLIYGYKILLKYLPFEGWAGKHRNILLIFTLISTAHFLNLNVAAGQMTIFMVFACIKALDDASNGKSKVSAAWLAIASIIKIMPVVLIPYLLYRGHFKTIIFYLVFAGLLIVGPAIFFGDYFFGLIVEWKKLVFDDPIAVFYREHAVIAETLGSVLLTYLSPGTGESPFQSNFLNLDIETVYNIYKISLLLIISLTLVILDKCIFKELKNDKLKLFHFSWLMITVPVIFPMQQKYSYLFLAPAYIFSIHIIINNFLKAEEKKGNYILIAFVTISLLLSSVSTMDGLVGFAVKRVSEWYRFTVFGGIILGGGLLYCKKFFTVAERESFLIK